MSQICSTEDRLDGINDCVFCKVYQDKDRLIDETARTFTIHDRSKGSASEHLLVCPKEHIKHIGLMNREDAELLKEMKGAAERVASKLAPNSEVIYGFHKPPFYTIKHLHLHVVVLPISNSFYKNITFGCIFHSFNQELARIEKL